MVSGSETPASDDPMGKTSSRPTLVIAFLVAQIAILVGLYVAVNKGWFGDTSTATAAARIPRTPDGHPDFSGMWSVMNTANYDIEAHHARVGVPPGLGIVEGGPLPYGPEALETRRDNYAKRDSGIDVDAKCFMPGVPRVMYEPYPFQIVQTPARIVMLFQSIPVQRFVFMNSMHPEGPLEFWMGDSRGAWDRDTLVVDVMHLNADPWLDRSGNYHSEQLRVVERYTYLTPDHIQYTAVLTDPQVFTRPVTIKMILYRQKEPGAFLMDNECYGLGDADIKPKPPLSVQRVH